MYFRQPERHGPCIVEQLKYLKQLDCLESYILLLNFNQPDRQIDLLS